MEDVIKMFKKYCSDDYDITEDFTSALDKKTSEELMGVMRKISKSILVVAITHDKSVVDAADHKYEIRNGNIFKK